MALLVEGLGVGSKASIEEYIIGPDDLTDDQDPAAMNDRIRLYGPQEGLSWIAKPVTGQSSLGLVSRCGSMENKPVPLMDPLVTLFGSVHEKLPETGSMRSVIFPNFSSMFSISGNQPKNEESDEESLARDGEDYPSDAAGGDSDDNLQSPLISRQNTSLEKDLMPAPTQSSNLSMRHSSLMRADGGEQVSSSMGIGGGWQLAWKWSEKEGQDGKKEGGFKRIYLHQDSIPRSQRGSLVSVPGGEVPVDGEMTCAAALVSQPALYSKELMDQNPVGPAMVHPFETRSRRRENSGMFRMWQTYRKSNLWLFMEPSGLEVIGPQFLKLRIQFMLLMNMQRQCHYSFIYLRFIVPFQFSCFSCEI